MVWLPETYTSMDRIRLWNFLSPHSTLNLSPDSQWTVKRLRITTSVLYTIMAAKVLIIPAVGCPSILPIKSLRGCSIWEPRLCGQPTRRSVEVAIECPGVAGRSDLSCRSASMPGAAPELEAPMGGGGAISVGRATRLHINGLKGKFHPLLNVHVTRDGGCVLRTPPVYMYDGSLFWGGPARD